MAIGNIFDHKYPTENLHELDLSWVISKVKSLKASVDAMIEVIEELKPYIDRFSEFEEALRKLQIDFYNLERLVKTYDDAIASLKTSANLHSEQIALIKVQLQALEDDYEALFRLIDIKNRQLELKIDNKLDVIIAEFHSSDDILRLQIKQLKELLQNEIEGLNERLTRLEDDSFPVDVKNPITGTRLSFDENNTHVYVDLGRLTRVKDVEIFEANMTDEEINNLNLTDYEASMYGGKYFYHRFWIHSPFTGVKTSVHNCLSELLGLILNSSTDEAINDLAETDLYFNDLNLTDLEFNSYQF